MSDEKFDNRRRFERELILMSGAILMDGESTDVIIRDISAGGAKISVPGKAPENDRFQVGVKGGAPLNAKVCWRDGEILGVQFDERPDEVRQRLGDKLKS